MNNKQNVKSFIVFIIMVAVILIGIGSGSTYISGNDVVGIILNKLFGIPLSESIERSYVSILWDIRLPRVILAFLVGAAISVSGAITQSVLKNSLASPFTLGVSSGASLGACITIVLGITLPIINGFTLPFIGFVFSVVTIVMILKLSQKLDRNFSNNTIILIGMVISLFLNGILTIFTSLASNSDVMRSVVMWQMGSFAMRGWSYVIMCIPFFVIGMFLVSLYVKELDILTFGEENAKSVGVDVEVVKQKLFLVVAILSGSAVALSGTIGFLDLITPHIVRRLFGSNHIKVIPMCAIIGGTIMVATDLFARSIIPTTELPVGAVTALFGAPFFAYIYFSKSK